MGAVATDGYMCSFTPDENQIGSFYGDSGIFLKGGHVCRSIFLSQEKIGMLLVQVDIC